MFGIAVMMSHGKAVSHVGVPGFKSWLCFRFGLPVNFLPYPGRQQVMTQVFRSLLLMVNDLDEVPGSWLLSLDPAPAVAGIRCTSGWGNLCSFPSVSLPFT